MGGKISTMSDSQHTGGITMINKHAFKVDVGRQLQVLMMGTLAPALIFTISLRVMSDFNEGKPFIGVLTTRKSLTDISIPNDPDLILWSLKDRFIYWRGKVYCKTEIAYSPGCDIGISWNMKTNTIQLQVKSAGGNVQTDEIITDELDCEQLWPVFGAITVGSKQAVEFELLPELQDVTNSVRFVSAGGKVSVSRDSRVITRSNKDSGNSVVLIDRVLTAGTHQWKLLVVTDFGASIAIGLATLDFKLSDRYLRDPMKHVYSHKDLFLWRSYRGHLYSNGRQLPHSLEPLGWQKGSTVEVELTLDMKEGTLTISKNGRDLGVAFRDIQGPVRPAVALYAGYAKEVHLMEFRSSDPISSGGDVVEPDSAVVQTSSAKVEPDSAVVQTSSAKVEPDSAVVQTSSAKVEPDSAMVRTSSAKVEPNSAVFKTSSAKVTFDPKSINGKLSLSDNGLTLTREKEHSGNAYCLLDVSLSSGFHRWSFIIENDQGASTCIGVAREPITLSKTGNLYLSQDLYVLRSFQGILYSEGREVRKGLSEFWLSGSLVEVSFEVQPRGGGVLRFSVNGEDQGIAFSAITPPVRPVVGFYAGMEKKVTLIHYENVPLELSSKLDENKLHTENGSHSSKRHPMPVILSPSDVSMYYPACMVCSSPVDAVALPCKHSYMCANHLDVGQNCLICDEPVTGVWNILLM